MDSFHLLIVDDERLRKLLGQFLKENIFEVSIASSVFEAEEPLPFTSSILWFWHLMIPNESGLELAQELRYQKKQKIGRMSN